LRLEVGPANSLASVFRIATNCAASLHASDKKGSDRAPHFNFRDGAVSTAVFTVDGRVRSWYVADHCMSVGLIAISVRVFSLEAQECVQALAVGGCVHMHMQQSSRCTQSHRLTNTSSPCDDDSSLLVAVVTGAPCSRAAAAGWGSTRACLRRELMAPRTRRDCRCLPTRWVRPRDSRLGKTSLTRWCVSASQSRSSETGGAGRAWIRQCVCKVQAHTGVVSERDCGARHTAGVLLHRTRRPRVSRCWMNERLGSRLLPKPAVGEGKAEP
jgi:hypothetical protein